MDVIIAELRWVSSEMPIHSEAAEARARGGAASSAADAAAAAAHCCCFLLPARLLLCRPRGS